MFFTFVSLHSRFSFQVGFLIRVDTDGAFIQNGSDRRAVLDFLIPLSKRSGWPTGHLVSKLQEQWFS